MDIFDKVFSNRAEMKEYMLAHMSREAKLEMITDAATNLVAEVYAKGDSELRRVLLLIMSEITLSLVEDPVAPEPDKVIKWSDIKDRKPKAS